MSPFGAILPVRWLVEERISAGGAEFHGGWTGLLGQPDEAGSKCATGTRYSVDAPGGNSPGGCLSFLVCDLYLFNELIHLDRLEAIVLGAAFNALQGNAH